jgi:hypothetical protein
MDQPGQSLRHLVALAGITLLAGCGTGDGPRVVHGSISIGDEQPDSGEIHFVPIEGTAGSVSAAVIVDGQYRIEGRGGVPAGKYRVEIVAKKKSGQQTQQDNGFEMVTDDEQLQISPPLYAGTDSPLTHEVSPDGGDEANFNLPKE